MHVDVESVHWEGDRFRAECEVDSEPLRVTGEVAPARDGRVDHLRVRYAFPRHSSTTSLSGVLAVGSGLAFLRDQNCCNQISEAGDSIHFVQNKILE